MQMDETQLIATLQLWRNLVVEGGVPRYTVIPGAALNTLVTDTDSVLRSFAAPPALSPTLHPADREAIALALVNEARRFSGFALYDSLAQLEPHRYRDQLRYADAILALSGSLAPAEGDAGSCTSCGGLNISCPAGCERDPKTGELAP